MAGFGGVQGDWDAVLQRAYVFGLYVNDPQFDVVPVLRTELQARLEFDAGIARSLSTFISLRREAFWMRCIKR